MIKMAYIGKIIIEIPQKYNETPSVPIILLYA
jgi:hypothetical protein